MASISVQARIDGDDWEEMRSEGESNTQLLQRIAAHYKATSGDELLRVAPTPDAAVAVLLHSHRLLTQLVGSVAIACPETVATEPTAPDLPMVSPESPTAFQSADEW